MRPQNPLDRARDRLLKKGKKPADYLRGGTKVGESYTAWDTYGQGKPDMGSGAGPGEPYHEVQKKVSPSRPNVPSPQKPDLGTIVSGAGGSTLPWGNNSMKPTGDPRVDAIRRRLRGL